MDSQPKIGAGALQAFLRQGAKEVAQALPALPDSIRIVEEPGAIGNPTPQEVFASKQESIKERSIEMDMDR